MIKKKTLKTESVLKVIKKNWILKSLINITHRHIKSSV